MTRLAEGQKALLVEIGETGPVSIGDLAAGVGRTESATRSAVRRLELRGLVEATSTTYRDRQAWFLSDEGERIAAAWDARPEREVAR